MTAGRTRVPALREALATRVVVADGAMGTMLQAQNPSLEDFQELEDCNAVLQLTLLEAAVVYGFRPEESGEQDVVGFQVVTVGSRIGEETARLFEADSYRDYLELHGLSVQPAEALAEYWHARVRAELGFAGEDPADAGGRT